MIISAPCPPVRESCPVPPTSLNAFELPVALATEIVTLDPSAAVKTALFASVELFCVADVAVNPLIPVAFNVAPEAIITTSSNILLAKASALDLFLNSFTHQTLISSRQKNLLNRHHRSRSLNLILNLNPLKILDQSL